MELNDISIDSKTGLDICEGKTIIHLGLPEIFKDQDKVTVWKYGYSEDAEKFAVDSIIHESLHAVLHSLFNGDRKYHNFSECAYAVECLECRLGFGCAAKFFWKLRGS